MLSAGLWHLNCRIHFFFFFFINIIVDFIWELQSLIESFWWRYRILNKGIGIEKVELVIAAEIGISWTKLDFHLLLTLQRVLSRRGRTWGWKGVGRSDGVNSHEFSLRNLFAKGLTKLYGGNETETAHSWP